MIIISDKRDCCGCSACEQICPKQCIRMVEDDKGFSYPQVDTSICVDCHLCERICPCLNHFGENKPIHVYAMLNPDNEVRLKSSSGGVFSLLAESILNEGGVVFGARFNDSWEVIHDYIESKEDIYQFRGSKYVQSHIGKTYIQAQSFLNDGRLVLFSGTPCQVAGLKHFLKKEYENLYTVEVVCHGVPSPLVWREYLKFKLTEEKQLKSSSNQNYKIKEISFRDKTNGWKNFSFYLCAEPDTEERENSLCENRISVRESLNDNLFIRCFLKNLILRPSCNNCPARKGKSQSDISLADYWGIEKSQPDLYDDKGTSLVLINSLRGEKLFNNIKAPKVETTYEDALKSNMCIEYSIGVNEYIKPFWKSFKKSNFQNLSWVYGELKPSVVFRVKRRINLIVKRLINF